MTVVGILIALLLPAIQSARETARRAHCANNLKQLALATLSYQEQLGCFPMGTPFQFYPDPSPRYGAGHSIWVAILNQLDEKPLYNAVNFNTNIQSWANSTIRSVGLNVLRCPSDGSVFAPNWPSQEIDDVPPWNNPIAKTNYGGCVGTWYNFPDGPPEERPAMIRPMMVAATGTFYLRSRVRGADIIDGLSTTLLIGERAHGRLDAATRQDHHGWYHGSGDTLFTTYNPINPWRVTKTFPASFHYPNGYTLSASSFHRGGANFAFADGSVRFIRDDIDTWAIDPETGRARGVTGNFATPYQIAPGIRLGVYQALSTRHGREAISEF